MKRIAGSVVAPAIVATAVLGTAALSVTAGSPFADASRATTVSRGATTTADRVAGKVPGWRVIATVGPYDGQVSGMLTAATPKSGWSVWAGRGFTAVERWNGAVWQQVRVPPKLTGAVRSAVAFDGAGPADFWLFSPGNPAQALRYSGHRWATQQIPSWALRKPRGGGYQVVANVRGSYARSQVWVFSLNAGASAAYYTGRAWHKESLPSTPLAVDVDASGGIWALGARVIMHWDRSTGGWHTMPLPPLPPGGLPGGTIRYTQLTAASGRDLWVIGQVTATGGAPRDVWFTQHWNGRSWGFHVGPANFAGSVAPDGHGGLWADSIDANPGGFLAARSPLRRQVDAGDPARGRLAAVAADADLDSWQHVPVGHRPEHQRQREQGTDPQVRKLKLTLPPERVRLTQLPNTCSR